MDTSFSSVSTRSSSSGAPTVYEDLDTSSTPYASAGTFVNRHSGESNRWSFFARRRSRQYPRRRCERDAQNVQRKFQKLERENRKLRIIFYLLISACFVVVFTYLCLTVVFIAAYSKQHDNSGTILSWTGSRHRQNADLQDSYCVEEKDVEDKLKKFWDKATSDTNTRYNIGGRKRRCFDFPDVKWIPRLLNSVNSSIHNVTDGLDANQTLMCRKLGEATTLYPGRIQNVTCTANGQPPKQKIVFAHLSLAETQSTPGKGNSHTPLIWKNDTRDFSGLDVTSTNEEIKVRTPGFYFVYGNVAYKQESHHHKFEIFRNHQDYSKNGRTILLSATRGRVSFVQGLFCFQQNDALAALTSTHHLDMEGTGKTYLGVYLVRSLDNTEACPRS